ncbi:uncharacterized protein LOC125048221 [Penaeus chinensis]|uniref:uncharacterized protein LOC125048221 n=1 Tax=Penaeus chinensis TaxID=139456 RepID=UPI001FB81085|nr:uncharacterized protein LOC125048221 [Penaeus chinensis]XP_047502749.1 uncharacterized protein LOC125048221 [Penaeus chinensis]
MPYQGDRTAEKQPGQFTTDVKYIRKLPGALIVVQLICCSLGFILAVCSSVMWKVRAGHGFFTFVSFIASVSCINWLVIHVFQIYLLFNRSFNWNILGLAHNGLCGFLLMIASCVMVELASAARALRAAGVFGFLGFTGFLAGLVWEVMVWLKNRDSGPGFATATVVSGLDRPGTPDSGNSVDVGDEVATRDNEDAEAAVGFVGMKARPVSSFIQEPRQNGGVTTPMLYAPGKEGEDDPDRPRSRGAASENSSCSSVEGEWQTPS